MFLCVDTQGLSRTGQTGKKSLLCFLARFYPRSLRAEKSLSSCFTEPLPFTSPALRNLIDSDRDIKYSKDAPNDQSQQLAVLNWGSVTCWLCLSRTCPQFRSDLLVC